MICSVLITSRKRTPFLRTAIQSWIQTPGLGEDYELVIRSQTDDLATTEMLQTEFTMPGIKTFVGEPLLGYASMHLFLYECQEKAVSTWVWPVSDDCTIEGPWVERLRNMYGNAIAYAGIEQNGGSYYRDHAGGPFPIVPRGMLTKDMNSCLDIGIADRARIWRWPIYFLRDVTLNHQMQPRIGD